MPFFYDEDDNDYICSFYINKKNKTTLRANRDNRLLRTNAGRLGLPFELSSRKGPEFRRPALAVFIIATPAAVITAITKLWKKENKQQCRTFDGWIPWEILIKFKTEANNSHIP